MGTDIRPQLWCFVVLSLLCSLTLSSYWPGLSGPFLFDDFHNLEPIAIDGGVRDRAGVLRYMFGIDGHDWARSVARLSFLVDDQYWPGHSFDFKLTNLLIHLINGLLLFLLSSRLIGVCTNSACLKGALTITAVWLVLPMHVTVVLYVVQRMALLSVTFIFLSLYLCVIAFSQPLLIRRLPLFVFAGFCAILALLSKENAPVLLLLLPLIYGFLYSGNSFLSRIERLLIGLLPIVFVVAFFVAVFATWSDFSGRDFAPFERLAMQGSILWYYLYQMFWLADSYTLFHDGIWLERLPLAVHLMAWFLHLLLAWSAFRFRHKAPLCSVGVLWFYAAHSIESSLLPLELMFEHRNYLPAVGIVLAIYGLLSRVKIAADGIDWRKYLVAGFLSFCVLSLVYNAFIWSDSRVLVSKWAADHSDSLRAQSGFVSMLEANGLQQMAYDKVEQLQEKFQDPALELQKFLLACQLGHDLILDPAQIGQMPYNSGVLYEFGRITKIDNACVENSINGGRVALAGAIENMPLHQGKPRYLARFYDLASNLYIKEGDYRQALVSREEAFRLQPTVPTALKLVELLIAGGDLELAKEYLARAWEIDSRRWFRDPASTRNIRNLEAVLVHLEEGQSE